LSEPITNINYDLHEKSLTHIQIRDKIHTISCKGELFYSLKEAGERFGLSDERIRQKINSDKHTDYFYLFS
jgi:hypothetical protein